MAEGIPQAWLSPLSSFRKASNSLLKPSVAVVGVRCSWYSSVKGAAGVEESCRLGEYWHKDEEGLRISLS